MHCIRSSAHTAVCIPHYLLERIPIPIKLDVGLASESVWTLLRVEKNVMPLLGFKP